MFLQTPQLRTLAPALANAILQRQGKKKICQTAFKIPICCCYTSLPPSVAPRHGAATLCLLPTLSLWGSHISTSTCRCSPPQARSNWHLGLSKVIQLLAVGIFLPVSSILHAHTFNGSSRSRVLSRVKPALHLCHDIPQGSCILFSPISKDSSFLGDPCRAGMADISLLEFYLCQR